MTGSVKIRLRSALFIVAHEGPASLSEETTVRQEATRILRRYLVGEEEKELRSLWKGRRNPLFLRKLEEVKARLVRLGDL